MKIDSNISFPSTGCTLDGIYVPCDMAYRVLNQGAAVQCPENDCGPRAFTMRAADGQRIPFLTTPFQAFANGVSGHFLPSELGGSPQSQADWYLLQVSLAASGVTPNQLATGDFNLHFTAPQNPSPGTIQDLRKSIYDDQELLAKINSCLKKLLGKNFNKVGEQTLANAPKIDARLSSNQIAAKFNMSAGPYATGAGHVGGTYGTIFIGKEWFSNPTDWTVNGRGGQPGRTPLQNAYVHELGNIASYRASRGTTYGLFGVKGATDEDSGYALQACVFNESINMKTP